MLQTKWQWYNVELKLSVLFYGFKMKWYFDLECFSQLKVSSLLISLFCRLCVILTMCWLHSLLNQRNSFFPLILDIDDCESVPCKNNATCIDYIDEFSCQCSPGYYGDNCTESKDHILIYHYVTIVCEKKLSRFKLYINRPKA